jgi:hypothetical protein
MRTKSEMNTKLSIVKMKGKYTLEDVGINGRIILKQTLE